VFSAVTSVDFNLYVSLHFTVEVPNSMFEQFGDTMNVASRMESTGIKGKIQLSQETADLLTAAGKGTMITPREDKVNAKGKFIDGVGKFSLTNGCSNRKRRTPNILAVDVWVQGDLCMFWKLNFDR
jgi:hypothetical protein